MGILIGVCDICGKQLDGEDIYTDYDGVDRCHKCNLESNLYDLQQEYKNKMEWLKSTHILYLKRLKNGIREIEKELMEFMG